MIHLKFTKILVAILAANLLIEPISAVYTPRDLQAEETFSNVHSLYQYWCSNDYGNFPENVGDVYCYYRNNDVSDLPVEAYVPENSLAEESYADEEFYADYDRVDSYTDYNRTEKNSSRDNSTKDITEDIIEVDANDENYVLVIGLTEDTIEAEQEILSKLQDKSHTGFASCKYSYNELKKVHEEIFQMMIRDTGICGAGITCSVSEPDSNGTFSTMENYVYITILPEFYKETAAMLEETYGDKVRTYSGEMAVNDAAVIDESIEKKIEEDNENGMGIDIGGMTEPVYTDGIHHPAPETSNKKKSIQETKALTVNDIFTFQTNWKKTAEVTWTITGKGKAEVLSKKTNGYHLKIQAKKAGLIKITARNNKNKKTISQKVLILDKNGMIANQNNLLAALQSEEVKKITIKTEKKKMFTIPKGEYGNKKIIINAPKSEITVEEPSILENILYKKSKQIRILGITRKKAKQVFGDPVGSLSGFDGDIFEMKNKTRVIAYYSNSDSNTGIVNGSVQTEDRPAKIEDEAVIPIEEISIFYGTILEIYGNGISALVEPDQDAAIRASGDQVSVHLAINTIDNFSVGDRVEVKYYGEVMESYPLQINELEVNKVI